MFTDVSQSPSISTQEATMNQASTNILELEGLEQKLVDASSGETFTVLVEQPLIIPDRSLVAILGPSGCGKTTLLTVLGLLRSPSNPEKLSRFNIRTPTGNGDWVTHDLKDLWCRYSYGKIESLRRQHLGFSLQSGELIPSLTVRENISVPLHLNRVNKQLLKQRVDRLLDVFGLESSSTENLNQHHNQKARHLGNQRINKLSGGEYQRVSLARAMVHEPAILFVDEPTSALNRELAHNALKQVRIFQCSENTHGAAIMITHDENLALSFADIIVRMAPRKSAPVGEIVEIVKNTPLVTLPVNMPEEAQAENMSTSPVEVVENGVLA